MGYRLFLNKAWGSLGQSPCRARGACGLALNSSSSSRPTTSILTNFDDHICKKNYKNAVRKPGMPEYKEFEAWITCDGQRLRELHPSQEGKEASCWVACELGKVR